MSSSPSVAYGKDLIWASITVEDYKVLSTARTLTLGFEPTATIEQALQKISRKGNVHLQTDIKMFGLYLSKKPLDPSETFQGLGFKLGVLNSFVESKSKEKINLTLKRAAKTVTLTIVFEIKAFPSTTETCQKNDTIQKLIEQLAEKFPGVVDNTDDDSCALFLPTKKSKRGILLERNKTLKSYHLTDGSTLLLKNRSQSEIILQIEIEDYEELQCARVVTSIFQTGSRVSEAIAKTARRSNVFIDDIGLYKLVNKSTHKRLHEDYTLAECDLSNRDTLILAKKTSIFGTVRRSSAGSSILIRPEFIEPSRSNAIMIGEKNTDSKKNTMKFYSQETEILFGTLSTRELLTKSEREELLSPGRSPSALDRPYIPTFPRRSLQMEPEIKEQVIQRNRSSSDSDIRISQETNSSEDSLERSNDTPLEKSVDTSPPMEIPEIDVIPADPDPPRPAPKRLTRKPGALPKKAAKQVISDENWKLIRIYQDTEKFWTLAVNPECSIRDILISIKEKASQSIYSNAEIVEVSKSYLESRNLDSLSPRKLEKDMKLNEIKKTWESEDQYILLLREGASRGLLSVPSDSEERPRNLVHKNSLFIKQNQAKWLNEADVLRSTKISKGGFAKVYLGKYENRQVAIKTLIGESFSESHIMNFKSEFEILCTAKSPYLVEFIGAYISSSNRPCFVMEYCANGSMYDAMNNKEIPFDWPRVLTWMMQTVKGIEALHGINLVHRDIKSLNLLLDKDLTVKVCDFGLSRFRTMTNFTSLGELRGTMAYCAPEIFNGHVFSPSSDIYSLGVVLWELCLRTVTGMYKKPFSEYEDIQYDYQIIIRSAKDQLRPTIPETCPPTLSQLIQDCWTPDKDKRPSCVDIIQRLQSIEELYLNDKEKFSGQN